METQTRKATYFFIALPFCGLGIVCCFCAFVTWFDKIKSKRLQTFSVRAAAAVVGWGMAIFFLSL